MHCFGLQTMPESTTLPTVQKPVIRDFGDGRYSPAMRELYRDSQILLGLKEEQAFLVARTYGADLGRYSPALQIKFGKLNKDAKLTLKETATVKGVTLTHAISIAKLCVLVHEAKVYGLVSIGEVKLTKDISDWIVAAS